MGLVAKSRKLDDDIIKEDARVAATISETELDNAVDACFTILTSTPLTRRGVNMYVSLPPNVWSVQINTARVRAIVMASYQRSSSRKNYKLVDHKTSYSNIESRMIMTPDQLSFVRDQVNDAEIVKYIEQNLWVADYEGAYTITKDEAGNQKCTLPYEITVFIAFPCDHEVAWKSFVVVIKEDSLSRIWEALRKHPKIEKHALYPDPRWVALYNVGDTDVVISSEKF